MKIDPRHLTAVELIRRSGGLTRAAEQLGTSQPALSRLISELEARLEGPIFERATRPWTLTKLGAALARQGASILFAQDRAAREITTFRSGTAGTLRIAGPPFFTDGVVSRLLPEFHRRHPDVSFTVSYGYASELRAAILSGAADLAIYPRGVGELETDLRFTYLLDSSNLIVCRTDHPILRLAYPSPLALLDYGWVLPPEGSPLAADMVAVLSALEMQEAEIVFSGGSLASVMSFIETSDCLSVLPGMAVQTIGPLFGIRQVPVSVETNRRALGILTRAGTELDHTTRTMVAFLQEKLAA